MSKLNELIKRYVNLHNEQAKYSKKDKIDTEKIIDVFSNKKGLLTLDEILSI